MQFFDWVGRAWHYELVNLFGASITIKNLFLLLLVLFFTRIFLKLYRAFVHKTLKKTKWFDEERADAAYRIGRILIIVMAVFLVFSSLNLRESWGQFLNHEIVHEQSEDEGFSIKVYNIFLFFLVIIIGRRLIRLITSITKKGLQDNPSIDAAQEFNITKLVGYALGVITFLVAVNSAGFNLTALLFGSAALLVALGLGIQHIFDDIISGLILLFDPSFQVGDVVQFEGMIVQIKHIDIRTTKLLTKDGVTITMPNSKLTNDSVRNLSSGNSLSRYAVEVNVAYGSDLVQVKETLQEVAKTHPDVNSDRSCIVRFADFGDSALRFSLHFWTSRNWDVEVLQSELRFAINEKFNERNIKIPFPQREIYTRQMTSEVF